MKKHYSVLVLTVVLLSGVAAFAQPDDHIYMDSTNRLTLSLRFGVNIKARFSGIGGSYQPGSPAGNGRLTPNGDPYNYDNGYVLTDSTGNALGLSTYWGYDNTATQYNPVTDTIAFNRTTASGIPSDVSSGGGRSYPGVELAYDRQLLEKENWHDLRFGVEGALNFMNVSLNNNSAYQATVTTTTTIYQLPGTTPPTATPGAPFQGTYDGSPGGYSLIGVPPTYPTTTLPPDVTPGAVFLVHDHLDADLWGGRLGPYVELPLSKKWDLRLSGGLALGLLDSQASWNETLTIPGGGGSMTTSGGGRSFDVLWGYYVSLGANWQFSRRWAVDGAAQFQDLGTFSHNFQGRQVELDLSRSIFYELGVSYSF